MARIRLLPAVIMRCIPGAHQYQSMSLAPEGWRLRYLSKAGHLFGIRHGSYAFPKFLACRAHAGKNRQTVCISASVTCG
jgi:hypothetical protein